MLYIIELYNVIYNVRIAGSDTQRNIVEFLSNQIVFTMHRLMVNFSKFRFQYSGIQIYNQTDNVRLVPNQSGHG